MTLKRELGFRDLFLLNIAAIVTLRWIAKAAAPPGGISSLGLWVLAFLLFFIPQAVSVITLSNRYPEEGGIYSWTKRVFGETHGFICGWLYWTSNMIYFPTLLVFIVGNSAFIGGLSARHLSNNRLYIAFFSLAILWIAVGFHILGLKTGKWIQNIGAIGIWIPALILVACGVMAVFRHGSANIFQFKEAIPNLSNIPSLKFLSAICFAFAGLELGPLMTAEIKNPDKNIPRSIVSSGIVITLIYFVGTAVLLITIPLDQISGITGVSQAIDTIGLRIGISSLGPILAIFITVGGIGTLAAWIGGTARVPFEAGVDKYLPGIFAKLHPRWNTPWVALLVPGFLSSILIVISFFKTGVEQAYNILVDSTIILNFIPYLYLFAAFIVQKVKETKSEKRGLIPRRRIGSVVVGGAGFSVTFLAVLLAIYPGGVSMTSQEIVSYVGRVLGICLFFILAGLGIFVYSRQKKSS